MKKTTSEIISKERTKWLISGSNVIAAVGRMTVSLEESKKKYGENTKFIKERTDDLNTIIEFYNNTEHYEEYLRNSITTHRLVLITLKVMINKVINLLKLTHTDKANYDEMKNFLQQEIDDADNQLNN